MIHRLSAAMACGIMCFIMAQQQRHIVHAATLKYRGFGGNTPLESEVVQGTEESSSFGSNVTHEEQETTTRQQRIHGSLVDILLPYMTEDVSHPDNVSVINIDCSKDATDLVQAFRSRGITNAQGMPEPKEGSTLTDEKTYCLPLDGMAAAMPAADFVTSFEVGEHLPETNARSFVQLLTNHKPRAVFFSAATENQDLGNNPNHVNEQPLHYWVDLFANQGYQFDAATTFLIKWQLVKNSEVTWHAWFLPKNILVFRPLDAQHYKRYQTLGPLQHVYDVISYLAQHAGTDHALGRLWQRDWLEFGALFRRAAQSMGEQQQQGKHTGTH